MYSYQGENFTIHYNSVAGGSIILNNTVIDKNYNTVKEKTIEINSTIECLQKNVNLYIDLHGFKKDLALEIEGSSVSDNSKKDKLILNVVELSGFLATIELRKEIYKLELVTDYPKKILNKVAY